VPPLPDTGTRPRIGVLGSGWLGLPLTRSLVAAGYRVNASTTTPSLAKELDDTGAHSFVFNINEINEEARKFLNSDFLIINIPSRDVESFADLADEIDVSSAHRVIYVSSTSVYPNTNSVIHESDGLESPDSPFFRIESLLRSHKRFSTTVLRFGGLVGYARHPGRFFSRGRVIPNPEGCVNLIHRDDCIGIIEAVLDQAAWGEVFNCCADEHPTRRAFYTHAARLAGRSDPVFDEESAVAFKNISNRKVKSALNYTFRHPDPMDFPFED
jgi:nucleoside-diphosphate-sugar epimerase